MITSNSINGLFGQVLKASASWAYEQRRGNRSTVDSPCPIMLHLTEPRNRVLSWPHRNNSVPAAAAETLWVLAGRDDMEFLKYYLPRATDFADDINKSRWRAGYGPRLRGKFPRLQDQLSFVVNELKARPNSRRAIVTLADPAEDIPAATAIDWPCTLTLNFLVRDGKLDLTVYMRSNDILWGAFGINIFEFTVMQEVVAGLTRIPLGQYYHISNSLHYYTDFEKRFEAMRNALPQKDRYAEYGAFTSIRQLDSYDQLGYALTRFFGWESLLRNFTNEVAYHNAIEGFVATRSNFGCLHDLVWAVLCYQAAHRGFIASSGAALRQMLDLQMRQSVIDVIAREQNQQVK